MPRYQIQSPDGRTVTVEGDHAPTQEDAAGIFSQLPAKSEPARTASTTPAPEMTFGDKAKIAANMLLGSPIVPNLETAKSIGLNSGAAIAGAELGALGGPAAPITVPLGAMIGAVGGNLLDQATRPGQTGIKKGELLASGLTGYLPGSSAVGAGGMALVKEALKAGGRGLLAKGAETMIDENRLPTAGEAAVSTLLPAAGGALAGRAQQVSPQAQTALAQAEKLDQPLKRETLDLAKEAGYVVPPADVNPSGLNNRLQGIGGKAATKQESVIKNQEITDKLAKKAASVPDSEPLNMNTLEEARQPFYETYKKVADLSKDEATIDAVRRVNPEAADSIANAESNLESFKKAKSAANGYYRTINQPNQYDYEKLLKAQDFEKQAQFYESELEKAAAYSGRAELISEFNDARVGLAKNHSVEQAFNPSNDHVDARPFGRAIKNKQILTGELEKVGRFAAAFPNQVSDPSRVGAAGVSALEAPLMGALAAGGAATMHNPKGMIAGLLPLVRGPVRAAILSRPYQNAMANIPAGAVRSDPVLLAQIIQEAGQAAGQDRN